MQFNIVSSWISYLIKRFQLSFVPYKRSRQKKHLKGWTSTSIKTRLRNVWAKLGSLFVTRINYRLLIKVTRASAFSVCQRDCRAYEPSVCTCACVCTDWYFAKAQQATSDFLRASSDFGRALSEPGQGESRLAGKQCAWQFVNVLLFPQSVWPVREIWQWRKQCNAGALITTRERGALYNRIGFAFLFSFVPRRRNIYNA